MTPREPAGWVGDDPVYLRDYEEEARQAARNELEDYRQQRLAAWKDAGGTDSEFDYAWPDIKEAHLLERTQGHSHEDKLQLSGLKDMRL